MPSSPNSGRVRRDLLLIGVLTALVVLPSFPTRDLWNPDEPRYMEVAREMVMEGDPAWLFVPHLNGEVYYEKPPLFFWLAGALYRLGLGVNSGRIVAGLAGFGTLALTYLFTRRFVNGNRSAADAPSAPGTGNVPLVAAVVTLTSYVFLAHVQIGVMDPLLMFCVVLSIFCGFHALWTGRRAWWLGAYAAAGLAVLTKGHVGIALPLVTLLVYGVWERKRVHGGGGIHAAGVALLLLFVAGWLVPAGMLAGGQYLRTLIVDQMLGRVVSSHSHRAGPHYYAMQYPLMFFPWSLLFLLAAPAAWRAWRRERRPESLACLAWFFALFALFTLVSGKRIGYLMPLVPAFGVLTAVYLMGAADPREARGRAHAGLLRWTFIIAAAISIVAVLAGSVLILAPSLPERMIPKYAEEFHDVSASLPRAMLVLGTLWLIGIAAACIYGARRARGLKPGAAVALLAGLALSQSLFSDIFVESYANQYKSGRIFCEEAAPFVTQAEALYIYPKEYSGVYNLYLRRTRIEVLQTPEALRAALAQPRRTAVIGREGDLLSAAPEAIEKHGTFAQQRVGHRRMVLIGNWPAKAR